MIITIHVIACIALVLLVLLQSGKEGMGVIFGGGGSTSLFGSSGAGGLLSKLTIGAATVFFITSLSYNLISSKPDQSPQESIMLEAPAGDQVSPEMALPPATTGGVEDQEGGQRPQEDVETSPSAADNASS
ncbi:MAG: preprotein translocase subunit SecG [Desulfohalobiaceae bacterium]